MNNTPTLRLLLIFLLVFNLAASVFGQDTVFIETNHTPNLGGHQFVLQPMIQDPFINSAFQMRMGVEGTVDFDVPPVLNILPDTMGTFEGDLLFVNVGARYDQRIKDWISFYLMLNLSVRTGTEVRTLLFEGLNTLTGGEVGLIFNLLNRPSHRLSGTFSMVNYSGMIIDFGGFVEDIIDGEPDPSISKSVPALTGGVGISYATHIKELLGITSFGQIQYGESIDRGDETVQFRIGCAVDLNFVTKGVPLGLSLGYSLRSTPDFVYFGRRTGHSISGKVAYTAAPNFVLGVELSSSIFPALTLPENVTTVGGMVNINYYFN